MDLRLNIYATVINILEPRRGLLGLHRNPEGTPDLFNIIPKVTRRIQAPMCSADNGALQGSKIPLHLLVNLRSPGWQSGFQCEVFFYRFLQALVDIVHCALNVDMQLLHDYENKVFLLALLVLGSERVHVLLFNGKDIDVFKELMLKWRLTLVHAAKSTL